MTVREAVRESLRLLTPTDRKKLLLATLFQVSTSLLDLLGVLLLGLVGALAVTTVQGDPPPSLVAAVANSLGLQGLSAQQLLMVLAAAAATVLLTKSLLSSLLLRRVFLFLASRQASVSARLTKELLSQPLTFIQARSSQETSYALIQGAGSATLVILGQAVIAVSEGALLLILGLALLFVNPVIAISSILFFSLVAVLLQMALGRWAARAGQELATIDISSLDSIQEALGAYREITVANRRAFYVHRIQELRWQAARVAADVQFMNALPKYIFEVALVVGGFALAGILFATQDSVSATATLALFLAAATRVMPSLLRLQGAGLILRGASGASAATLQLARELEGSVTPKSSAQPAHPRFSIQGQNYADFRPTLVVRDVDFTYEGASEPCIRGVSLSAVAGSSLAFVGASGAGKSTLADLLLGVLRPDHGHILIGELPPQEAINRWPGAIAYVPQDVSLANASVRSNVALGLPRDDIDDELVWDALRRAHLAEFLGRERDGLDTLIGERGVRLSGGQRQRLGIARALYCRPRLLILDEATSALDAETEVAISQTFTELEGDVTTIVIAHRLSTVRHVDQLVFLQNGQALAQGAFEDVRARVPAFDHQARLMGLT